MIEQIVALSVLDQFFHAIANTLVFLVRPFSAFALDRLDFVAHHPAVALSGLAVNALVVWWMVRTREINRYDAPRGMRAPTLS